MRLPRRSWPSITSRMDLHRADFDPKPYDLSRAVMEMAGLKRQNRVHSMENGAPSCVATPGMHTPRGVSTPSGIRTPSGVEVPLNAVGLSLVITVPDSAVRRRVQPCTICCWVALSLLLLGTIAGVVALYKTGFISFSSFTDLSVGATESKSNMSTLSATNSPFAWTTNRHS